MSKNYVCEGKL